MPTKAREKLGWAPEVAFRSLIEMMVDADVERWERATGKRLPPSLAR